MVVVVVMLAGWLETSQARMLASVVVVGWLGGVRVVVVATWPYLNFCENKQVTGVPWRARHENATKWPHGAGTRARNADAHRWWLVMVVVVVQCVVVVGSADQAGKSKRAALCGPEAGHNQNGHSPPQVEAGHDTRNPNVGRCVTQIIVKLRSISLKSVACRIESRHVRRCRSGYPCLTRVVWLEGGGGSWWVVACG